MYSNPKSILITGASSGIGAALAMHYAAPDVTLFINGRDQERLDSVAQQCREAGASVSVWVGDVTDEIGLREWIYSCEDTCPLNLVIANAGVSEWAGNVNEMHQVAADIFNVNVNGVFNTIHPALEIMSSRHPYPVRDAQVAIVSSIMGYAGVARSPAYAASKAAVKHYGEALRGAFKGMGIGVSVICPGYVSTALTSKMTSRLPFMVSAEKAADVIVRGLARNKARITFPWQMVLLARVVINLPAFITDRINRPWGTVKYEDVS
jgi:short-subunit dehydrogenase